VDKHRILLISNDTSFLERISTNAEWERFGVEQAGKVHDPIAEVERVKPDLILWDLDDEAAGTRPSELCNRLGNGSRPRKGPPLIILASRDEEALRIETLESGGEDCILKGLSDREIALRLRAVLQGFTRPNKRQPTIKRRGLSVDLDSYRVLIDGKPAKLTRREFKLLAELIRLDGKVQTRQALLDSVWGYRHSGSNTVETHVLRLRRKLGTYGSLVETVRGVGYRFRKEGGEEIQSLKSVAVLACGLLSYLPFSNLC